MTVLQIDNLRKEHKTPEGGRHVIVDVPRLVVESGEQVALSGHSGSGKTTLLNLIAGIIRADAGRILVDGLDVTGRGESGRDRLRATRIGYVHQTFNLLQGYSALENVEIAMMLGAGRDRAFARRLLERVGLADRLRYRPAQMSVGQQQRVAIARALANRPRLVLADEPTGNLDPANATSALELMRELCKETGSALLLVSHDPAVLSQFPRVESMTDINRAACAQTAA